MSEKGVKVLEWTYEKALNGIPGVSESIDELVGPYIDKYNYDIEFALKRFIRNQKLKTTTSGFLTGLGGAITLPVTLPADFVSSLYIEVRMIAGIAKIRGYDLKDDQVKTLVYLCLVGNSIGDLLKDAGIQVGKNVTIKKLLPKISGAMLTKINKAVGFRLLTKNGSKGIINLNKLVPVIGGFVSGGYNYFETSAYAKIALKMFN